MSPTPDFAGTSPVVHVTERLHSEGLPLVVHPDWQSEFDWLVQGTTVCLRERDFDLALFGAAPAGEVLGRWEELRQGLGFTALVHARQVHEATVRFHDDSRRSGGLVLSEACDGHLTRTPGLGLAVALADCVPVTLVHADQRAVALLHAGWRGTAAGIVARGVEAFKWRLGAKASELRAHLGPAICGHCYEVGPEVHQALRGETPPAALPIDIRAILRGQLLEAGVASEKVTVSTHCTRCEPGDGDRDFGFYSHRAGAVGRQIALAGIVQGPR